MGCSPGEKPKSENEEGSNQQWTTGVALYSFNRFPFVESLDKAKKAGVDYIEGFSFHKLGEDFRNRSIMELSDGQLARMKAMVEEKGLHMRSMYAEVESKADWKQLIAVANALKLEFLVGEPEPTHWDFLNELAGEHDIQIAIHQHAKGQSRYWHPDSVLVALEGRDHFGVCGDLGHWVRSGLDPVESMKKLEGRIISVHAKDLDEFGNIEANDVRIGSGVIDYKAVIEELERQSFSGPVYIEAEHNWEDNLESVRFGVDYIRQLRDD
ncbi:MAG TPA: sugar phosphate isomerase/epimerase [Fodinibius sp.]|nr:sugar phosphate isomerase/epimerase [Fodinibius sp.]